MTSTSSSVLTRLDKVAARFAQRTDVNDLEFKVVQPSTGLDWQVGSGRQHFITSATKMYTAATVMQLCSERKLTLEMPAVYVLGGADLAGLNTFGGQDHATSITVEHLLSHTSGIPDYFEQKPPGGTSMLSRLIEEDLSWSYQDVLPIARQLKAPFAPGTPGKASYSDTNFQLLGRIIETVEGMDYARAVSARILEPLGLDSSYVFTTDARERYASVSKFRIGSKPLEIPRAMASFAPDGGVVSTAADSIAFLRAFFDGQLFPLEYLARMTATWRRIFPPFHYGIGMMRLKTPRMLHPFAPTPEMLGHGSASGALLFHIPERDLYLAGTVNQVSRPALPYRLLSQLIAGVPS